jgi:release factor glutamine methyltransferase
VTPDVLDPRPETEVLVAAALEAGFRRVLDLGVGSGAILLSLLADRAEATGVGTDLSAAALAVAQANADALGVAARVGFQQADWFSGLVGQFDLIVSNPPYIAEDEMSGLAPEVRDWEPWLALTPGGDGLAAYRAIAAGVGAHLAPGGRVILEIGPTQGAAVAALLAEAGLEGVAVRPDLDGRDRIVAAWLPG